MDCETIKQLIQKGLPDADVDVQGEDGVHFSATVVCPAFSGAPTIKRHRMVYATLGTLMGNEIHALSLNTLSPDEATA